MREAPTHRGAETGFEPRFSRLQVRHSTSELCELPTGQTSLWNQYILTKVIIPAAVMIVLSLVVGLVAAIDCISIRCTNIL